MESQLPISTPRVSNSIKQEWTAYGASITITNVGHAGLFPFSVRMDLGHAKAWHFLLSPRQTVKVHELLMVSAFEC